MNDKQVVIYIVRELYSGTSLGPMALIIHCEKCLLTVNGVRDLYRAVEFQKEHKCGWELNPGVPIK